MVSIFFAHGLHCYLICCVNMSKLTMVLTGDASIQSVCKHSGLK
ncbi:hypothetical protein HanIR_Chr17g0867791 [Helianthus annuus]|nr:hypothetical protein HanIR_Chr17g0867791 [Helianthus annuus]